MGIQLKHERARAELQQLEVFSRAGDKKAQLQLGIKFEEGRDLQVDLRHAIHFSGWLLAIG